MSLSEEENIWLALKIDVSFLGVSVQTDCEIGL